MTFRNQLMRACIVLGTTFVFGATVLGCGGDDDDDTSAGAGTGTGGQITIPTGDSNAAAGSSDVSSTGGTSASGAGRGAGTAGRTARGDGGGANTCGCVDTAGQCHRGITTTNCGIGGGQCTACSNGQSCSDGVCVTRATPSTDGGRFNRGDAGCNCVEADGTCHSGTRAAFCGKGGGQCVTCENGQDCNDGVCVDEEDAG